MPLRYAYYVVSTFKDKEIVRQSLKELVVRDPEFVDKLLAELTLERNRAKKERLERIVKDNVDEYGDVFRALA